MTGGGLKLAGLGGMVGSYFGGDNPRELCLKNLDNMDNEELEYIIRENFEATFIELEKKYKKFVAFHDPSNLMELIFDQIETLNEGEEKTYKL